VADAWGGSWGSSWGVSWGSGEAAVQQQTVPTGGAGWQQKKRLYLFPDGTLGYCNEAEAWAIAAEMELHVPVTKVQKPKAVTPKSNAVVQRQQLIGFLKSPSIPDTGPARREVARLIRRLRENERRIKEMEELEEIALLLTLLH
jgi:hypothetical protein